VQQQATENKNASDAILTHSKNVSSNFGKFENIRQHSCESKESIIGVRFFVSSVSHKKAAAVCLSVFVSFPLSIIENVE
jgi:hypothetical protein